MVLISLQDRVTLLNVVTAAIPNVKNKYLRDMLLLMAALLHDYANLEQHARDQLHVLAGLTMDMQKMTADLNNMAKINGSDALTTVRNSRLQ